MSVYTYTLASTMVLSVPVSMDFGDQVIATIFLSILGLQVLLIIREIIWAGLPKQNN